MTVSKINLYIMVAFLWDDLDQGQRSKITLIKAANSWKKHFFT